jgi:hypothetical protein
MSRGILLDRLASTAIFGRRWLCAAVIALLGCTATPSPPAPSTRFDVSYAAGARDTAGRFMGGTELRVLTAYGGKLYAGSGYWEDRPGAEGPQSAAILVLDAPHARWRVDTVFDERLPNGRARDFAIAALSAVTFGTDHAGAPLPAPVSMLLASSWDRTGATRVFSRDDASGVWTATLLAQDPPLPDFLPQIRSFALHRDQRTGVDRVFAGNDPRGIFSGAYDPMLPGRIRWDATPELDIAAISTAAFPGLAGRLRVSSFSDANGALYAAVGQQIFERIDGAAPRWRLVYTNPRLDLSETGLRGLTAIPSPSGVGEVLLAAVEGRAARIVRVDPADGTEATELDLRTFLGDRWGMSATYVIAAYNDMTKFHDPERGDLLLIGLEAFIPPQAALPAGHGAVGVGYGRLEAGAWYLIRYPDGHYDLRQIAASLPAIGQALVATRAIRASPFDGDEAAVYFAGYDANKAPAHNTAWIVRAAASDALGDR